MSRIKALYKIVYTILFYPESVGINKDGIEYKEGVE